jgi:hypothetical protein
MADAITPVWDASGEYLYFFASTDIGLGTGWLDMSSFDHPVTDRRVERAPLRFLFLGFLLWFGALFHNY